jgi:hypothetical protein
MGEQIFCRVHTGKWLAETRSESSSTIINDHLLKTVELYQHFDDGNRGRAYFTLARYADGNFHRTFLPISTLTPPHAQPNRATQGSMDIWWKS